MKLPINSLQSDLANLRRVHVNLRARFKCLERSIRHIPTPQSLDFVELGGGIFTVTKKLCLCL